MFPPGHLGVAYCCYSLLVRSSGRTPAAAPVFAVVLGSQFPDLVDKPLAWYLGVLPTGRTLAHSLVVLVPVCILVYLVASRYDRSAVGVAFAVGAISHSLVDALPALWGSPADARFLLWPLLSVPGYDEDVSTSVTDRLYTAYAEPELASAYFLAEFALLAVAIVLWHRDGRPGLEVLGRLGQ